LNHFIQNIDKFGSNDGCAGSGRHHGVLAVENVNEVHDFVQGQHEHPQSFSMRQGPWHTL